ncbi:hypothetical protein BST61_g10407 [Cercospora zeina]
MGTLEDLETFTANSSIHIYRRGNMQRSYQACSIVKPVTARKSSITFRRISQTPSSITIHEICRVLSRML